MTVAIVYGVRTNGANTGATFSEGAAKTAIQGYLDALEHRDIDEIARNALCGLYDGVQDKRSDQALAKLSSDAFRKQFSEVQVTSIDKIVYLSQYQAQALFSMRGSPVSGGPARGPVQGIAHLPFQPGQRALERRFGRALGERRPGVGAVGAHPVHDGHRHHRDQRNGQRQADDQPPLGSPRRVRRGRGWGTGIIG